MAQYSVVLSPSAGASISLVLDLTQASQNVAGNYSTLNYNLYLYRNNTGGSSSFDSTNSSVKTLVINGTTLINSTTNWDFRSSSGLGGVGATNALGSGSINVAHNADGTYAVPFSASFTDGGTVTIGHGSFSNGMALTTIPRASTPTYSANPADAGTTITITTNRASGSFTHDISYVFGAASGSIGTGVGASTTWAIPLSLLNQIPNNTSGTATITTVTKSGGTTIGSKVQNLTIRAASDIVPDFTTVTHSEATTSPDVAAIVGAYVKDWSTLDVDITGAVGAYGSTISAYKVELLDGSTVLQTINAASGVTTPVTTSGTLTLRGTVTDSRGRTHSEDVSVSVLNYSLPVIELFTVARSTVGGTPDINGEYILIDLEAAVQSLIVGTQKNDLTWRIKTRERTDSTPWASITADYEDTVGAVGYDDDYILGTYPEANSYDIRVEVEDELGGIAFIEGVISTGGVLMQWSKTFDGVGFGKYWEQGSIDALDQIYQRNGKRVLDEDDLTAVDADVADVISDLGDLDDRVVVVEGLTANAPLFSPRIPLPLSQAIRPNFGYTWGNPLDPYVPFWLTRSSAGVVTIDGVGSGITVASGVVLAVLPAGYRPSREMNFQCAFNSGRNLVTVKANGEISISGAIGTTDYFAFSNVKFVATADEASFTTAWTNLTMQNSWIADGTHIPQYAVDQYGCVWLRGKVSKAGTWTDSQVIASLPSTYNKMQAIYNAFCPTYSTMRYGAAGGGVGSNIMAGSAVAGVSMTLDGILIVPDAIYTPNYTRAGANNSHPMGAIPFQGAWANYNAASFTSLGLWKRPDGLVIPSGLIMSGSLGTSAFQIPAGARPFQTQVFENSATMSIGQTTVYGPHGQLQAGSFVPVVGAATYISPEGIAWNAGN